MKWKSLLAAALTAAVAVPAALAQETAGGGIPSGRVISVNFAGADSGDLSGPLPDTEEIFGLVPVPGSAWVDLHGATAGNEISGIQEITSAYGSEETFEAATLTYSAKNMYGLATNSGILKTWLGDGTGAQISVTNIPFENYAVIVYFATNNGDSFKPVTVNNTKYIGTAAGSKEVTDTGNATWGSPQPSDIALGTNALRVNGLSGDLSIVGASSDGTGGARGCIAGFQIVEVFPSISVNFAGDASGTYSVPIPKTSEAYGLFPVPGSEWENGFTGSGTIQVSSAYGSSETFSSTLSYKSKNIWHNTDSYDTLLQTYLDDGTDTAKWLEAEREAMKRYTQDYGTFQDRIDAIKNEYTQKIAEAGGADTWQGKLLQKQMEEALSAIDMEKLKESINWELVFSDLGNASKESLEKVKRQLAEFKQSKEYQGMAVDQKKVIDESLDKIQSAIIDKGGLLGDLPNQLEELRKAQDELTAAQNEYNEAMRNGTDEQKEAAQRKLNKAEQNVANAQNNTDKAARQTTDNLLTLADALTQLGSSSEMTLTEIGQLAGGIANTFSEAGSKIGGIIGAILTLLDQIGQEGLFGFLDNVLSSVGNAVYGVFDSLLGWTGIDFGGESDEHLAEDIQRLTASNQELEDAISNLSDKMDDAAVADAGNIYQQQLENLRKQEANTLEMMQRSAAAYSNGFLGIGGTHSSAHKINEGMSAADWQAISEVVGHTIDDASDFFRLTSEEMWRVAQEATTEYAKLKDLADNGHKDAAQFMDEYIGYWQEMEELQDAYNEKLTSTSFDSIKDEFRNALLDMEDSTEAFADNFEKMMQNAILESMMTGTYDKALKDWYEDFAAHMAIGDMDTDTQEELRKQWQDIVDSASQQWNAWRDMMGWETDSATTGSTQSPQSGALTTMSQDSINTFEGIGRSLQTHLISLDKVTQELRDQNRADSESLLQIVNNTSYLLPIYELMEKMDRDGIKIQ